MYTLLVCADLYGEKHNLELNFDSMPTLSELQRKILVVFSTEANLRHSKGLPTVDFTIARIQIYDDVLLKWVDLISPTQLHEYDQLYVFQPQTSWHTDVQKDLPPPCPPSQSLAASAVQSISNSPQKGISLMPNMTSYRQDTSANSINSSMTKSPTKMRLEEQKRRERALQEQLLRVREESERLEREAAIEEQVRAREQEQMNRLLRQKEEEVRRQRESLMRSEEEFRRLLAEKRSLTSSNSF
ncbi:BILBO1 [Trypanosoma melophagium]|uniref:BILBO1 n=1 Tax=Trypanosoma melophagium TaxID=715481 RepID=UPI00351A70F6|nr:BILBO1 [Trypanosoma melophagium]